MGLLDVPDLTDVEELKVLDDGTEVKVTVKEAETVPTKDDAELNNLKLRVEVVDDPLVDDIYVYVGIPHNKTRDADPKKFAKQVERFKTICDCFGVEINSDTDSDDFIGRTADAILKLEDDATYGKRNSVKQWVVGA